MSRSLPVALALTVATLGTACSHQAEPAATQTTTTTITSTTTTPMVDIEPAQRLAGEICKHEATCNAPSGETPEGRLLREQACMMGAVDRTRAALGEWDCSPALQRARFEECLATIRTELCETSASDLDRIPACRERYVCSGEPKLETP